MRTVGELSKGVHASATGTVRDLQVWRLAMELAGQVYELCRSLPSSEQYGLVSQMQRSAVSIPSNIAEGYGRESKQDFQRFLYIARGSACELETQLLLTGTLYSDIQVEPLVEQVVVVQRMITVLIPKVVRKR